MGNPGEYITPDCIADFTTIRLEQHGKDRVRVSGVRGRPATDKLKVSIGYFYGYKAVGTLVYAWPDAYQKAQAADRILRQRLADLGESAQRAAGGESDRRPGPSGFSASGSPISVSSSSPRSASRWR